MTHFLNRERPSSPPRRQAATGRDTGVDPILAVPLRAGLGWIIGRCPVAKPSVADLRIGSKRGLRLSLDTGRRR